MRRIAVVTLMLSSLAIVPTAHADDAHADLTVRRVTPSVRSAHEGDRVVFRAVGQDLGPSSVDSSIDIAFVAYGRPHPTPPRNLRVLRVLCFTHGFGTPPDVSSDGAVCEFGGVPAQTKVWMKVVAVIAPSAAEPSDRATIRFCASNESGVRDPEPSNDCRRAHVRIV
jgi:hypothetical protein